jgi:hypothetical protein
MSEETHSIKMSSLSIVMVGNLGIKDLSLWDYIVHHLEILIEDWGYCIYLM